MDERHLPAGVPAIPHQSSSLQGKPRQIHARVQNQMYLNFEPAIYREPGDTLRFTYRADRSLAAEFEEQMTALAREYNGDGEYLSVITRTRRERWTMSLTLPP